MAHALRHLIAICFVLIVVPHAPAQQSGQIKIRFAVFSAQPVEGLAFISPTGSLVPLKFDPFARSARHAYSGVSPVRFVDFATKAVVAEAVVPLGYREPLFLFSALPAGNTLGLRYKIAVLDDSAASLPPGHFVILNLSGLKLAGTFDKSVFEVNEGLNAPVPFAASATLTLYAVSRGTRVQSFVDTLKPVRSRRLLLLLLPPARKGALQVQSRALVD